MRAILIRGIDNGVETLGNLQVWDGLRLIWSCKTLELAWKKNARNKSCIPPGRYDAAPRTNAKFGDHFILKDVYLRDGILFHAGNSFRNTSGCILLGMDYADLDKDGQMDVSNSKIALQRLVELCPDGFRLDVIGV